MVFFAYLFIFAVILLPLLIVIFLFKETSPKYYGYLFWGALLVVWAALVFGYLNDVKTEFAFKCKNIGKLPPLDQNTVKGIITNLELWIYIFPSVVAAIGANLITDFIKIKKPANTIGSSIT
ncbi:MAG: hypothetical protein PHR66_08440 [Desulfuromonadaceae bacterium]|nr:hypothetical protein [Desulfuromonadaceae bacterium]